MRAHGHMDGMGILENRESKNKESGRFLESEFSESTTQPPPPFTTALLAGGSSQMVHPG